LSFIDKFFPRETNREKKLWIVFALIMTISFAVLGYYGYEIYQQAPHVPKEVVSDSGKIVFSESDIKDGQNIWQSIGGQEVGSIWGHGAYVAPDWTADWLHREAIFVLNKYAKADFNKKFDELDAEKQSALKIRLQKDIRTNRYNADTGILAISENRLAAIEYLSSYYKGLFTNDPKFD
jgi:nitric oxide reductase subunit B